MKIRREHINIFLMYLVAVLYTIFVQNTFGIVFLILIIFIIHIYMNYMKEKQSDLEKETSLDKVLQRLDKTQKENEETYKRFLSLSKTLGSGVFMVDSEGKITFSNKDIENYFGIDFNSRDYNEIVEIKPLYKFVNKAYLTEERQRKQIEYKDHVYDLTSTPIFESDMFTGALILVHDITLLHSAENFQKRFTQDVSHELRTPLSAIKGFSEILNRDQKMTDKDRQEFLSLIQKEADRMEVILNDLMAISKLDRLDYELELEDVDVKDIIEESITILKPKIDAKGIAFSSSLESCILALSKVKISQVLINIIKNAINYTDDGKIEIQGQVIDKIYQIQIKDTGIGIDDAKKELIFKRFYRVDKARSRDTGGSGLGLSISKNVILKHEGNIYVKDNEDRGSIFVIELPIKK